MDLETVAPPADVIRLVLQYLDVAVLSIAAQVCRRWSVYAESNELWQALCDREGFIDPDLYHSIISPDAIDWKRLYIEKLQYMTHNTEEAMYEMFEELQNKYILSESQNEQLVLQLNQLIGELTAVKKGYRHLEKKTMHYNTLQSKYIILKERYKSLERRLQEVEVGSSLRSQQMTELKEQLNLKERKYKKLKEKYIEKRQELKNNALVSSSSTSRMQLSRSGDSKSSRVTASIDTSSSALDDSRNRTRNRTATVGGPLESSSSPITIDSNGRVKTVKIRMPESPTQGANFGSAPDEGSLADHVLDSEEELMAEQTGNDDESTSRSRSYSMSDAPRPVPPLPFITANINNTNINNTNINNSPNPDSTPSKGKSRPRKSSVTSDGSDDRKGVSATPLAASHSTSRILVMKSPRAPDPAHKLPADIALNSQVPMPTALWHVDFEELHFSEKVGMGAAATVYRGTFRESTVAIKILRTGESLSEEKDLDDFRKELEILKTIRAPNIVTFYGATLEPRLCMVLEYCARGSLHSFLKDSTKELTWELFFKWAMQCVRGVQVLHQFEPQIVHRDLKTPNLLIDSEMNLKVCDFGLSRFITGDKNNKTTLAKFRGTYCYMATEIYDKEQYSPKSDIYSVGVILWEMIHKCLIGSYEKPYAEYKFIRYDIQIPVQAATKNLRPTIPITCPEVISQVIRACWDTDPTQRPSSGMLLQRFEQLKKEYDNNAKNWDRLREFAKKKNL